MPDGDKSAMSPPLQTIKPADTQILMSFPDAMKEIMAGKKITRIAWKNEKIFGELKDEVLKLHKDDDVYYQWIVSNGDISAEDWVTI